MATDLQKAYEILSRENCTCVLCKGEQMYRSHRRGVAPLMGWLKEGLDLTGFSAADKVVGKATALLYCLLQVKEVYAGVISDAALQVLLRYDIPCIFDRQVPAIRNRKGDGLCPMEMATREVEEPAQAPAAIRKALEALTKGE